VPAAEALRGLRMLISLPSSRERLRAAAAFSCEALFLGLVSGSDVGSAVGLAGDALVDVLAASAGSLADGFQILLEALERGGAGDVAGERAPEGTRGNVHTDAPLGRIPD